MEDWASLHWDESGETGWVSTNEPTPAPSSNPTNDPTTSAPTKQPTPAAADGECPGGYLYNFDAPIWEQMAAGSRISVLNGVPQTDCAELCATTADCAAFSFRFWQSRCILSAQAGTKSKQGWVSYAKRAGTCRTEAPTENPTKQPTNDPTTSGPTNAPTKEPTPAPSPNPTNDPTTSAPTNAPTKEPTPAPSSNPTNDPTTSAPTNAPTKQPPPSTECVPAFYNAREDRMMKKESHIIRTRATNSEGHIVGVTIDTCAQHCGSTLNCVAFLYTSGSRVCVLLSDTNSKKAKRIYTGWSHFEMTADGQCAPSGPSPTNLPSEPPTTPPTPPPTTPATTATALASCKPKKAWVRLL